MPIRCALHKSMQGFRSYLENCYARIKNKQFLIALKVIRVHNTNAEKWRLP